MIAGPPGSFKSTLALNICIGWVQKGQKGLYISADSDGFTVTKRCAAIITGDSQDQIEKTIRSGAYQSPLQTISDLHFECKGMSMKGIELHMQAFEQKYGQFPDFVVIDNLMNCVEGPGDWNGQITMTRDLDELARRTSAHIMILHHTQEGHGEYGKPPPRWDIMGKVAQFPRLILTVAANGPHMMVATVKNTNGPQDPTGSEFEDFMITTESCQVEEVQVG